jgi:hypothetical protein
MIRKKLLAAALAVTMVLTGLPGQTVKSRAATEITLAKSQYTNPIGCVDNNGNRIYGGDPSVLVDGDTVYLYVGHDNSTDSEVNRAIYNMDSWICYSTKDMKNWKYEGPIMKADKGSVTWASTDTSAWAAQVAKRKNSNTGKDRYYLYYCTWDATSQGKQSIGVAVADKPTGPFKDIGKPLVKGTLTTPQSSNWDDIDPTVWVDTDSKGVEHRYLAWGNSRLYICELNEDMISVKDINGDGKITCGESSKKADILYRSGSLTMYTEAPWIYRRQDAKGNYYGNYYLFYASQWREKMAYVTTSDLMNGKWSDRQVIMSPTATSNTNHMAVFDFKGKTYFVYHNGSLPKGNGYRRSPCIRELTFKEDGSVVPMEETAAGLNGTTTEFYTSSGALLGHKYFQNSSLDGKYPYKDIKIGAGYGKSALDRKWVVTEGKADKTKASYVSIQSENKPGLYITANSQSGVTLAQDTKGTADVAKRQTFKTVEGLGDKKGVSLESVRYPGYYLTIVNGALSLTKGGDTEAATFYTGIDKEDTSLRSIGAVYKKNQILQGSKPIRKNITVTAFYANGTRKNVTGYTITPAAAMKKTGKKTLTVTYTEGERKCQTTVPVVVKVKPAKVKKLKARTKIRKKKTAVTLTWRRAKGEYYEISYGKKKKTHKKIKTLKASVKKVTLKRSVRTWKKGKKYYFHIRSYTRVNNTKKYSGYKTIRVKITEWK